MTQQERQHPREDRRLGTRAEVGSEVDDHPVAPRADEIERVVDHGGQRHRLPGGDRYAPDEAEVPQRRRHAPRPEAEGVLPQSPAAASTSVTMASTSDSVVRWLTRHARSAKRPRTVALER